VHKIKTIIIAALMYLALILPAKAYVDYFYIDDWTYVIVNHSSHQAAACVVQFPDGFILEFWLPPMMKSHPLPGNSVFNCNY